MIDLRLTGVEAVLHRLGAVGPAVANAAEVGIGGAADELVRLIQSRCPVETRNLHDSYGRVLGGRNQGGVYVVVGPRPGFVRRDPGGAGRVEAADYAAFVEMGTSRMAAQPHVRPAADEMAPRLARALGARVAGALGKAGAS